MRIGLVVPASGFVGGLEQHAHELARVLGERGHWVVLFPRRRGGRDPERYAAAFGEVRALGAGAAADLDVIYVLKAASVDELAPLAPAAIAIGAHDHDLTCVRTSRYLPLTLEPCGRSPGLACVAHGCCLVRDRSPERLLPLRLRDPFALRRRLLALADRAPIIACSRFIASELIDAGVAPERIVVAYPIALEDSAPVVRRPSAPRLLVACQLVRGKGVDLAIRALAELPREVTLDVAGDGPSRRKLARLAERVAPGRVRFHGFLGPEALRARFDAASVVILPSRWPEPFGMVGIEAMRRGRPVVGASHGGIPEWLEPGVCGELFAPGDVRDLARAAARALADDEAGERAARHVRARYASAAYFDHLEALFVRLATTAALSSASSVAT